MRNRVSRALVLCFIAGCTSEQEAEVTVQQSPARAAEELTPEEVLAAPNSAPMTKQAPANYAVTFETSKGAFVIEVTRALAPTGADRFYNLVRHGFYDDCRFFRMIPDFAVQWGINGDPDIQKHWTDARIMDDPVKSTNSRGTVAFAKNTQSAPHSRATQVFVNLKDNARLDRLGFAPFGQVTQGMQVLTKLYSGYEEKPAYRHYEIEALGNGFLAKTFPKLDYIKKATVNQ